MNMTKNGERRNIARPQNTSLFFKASGFETKSLLTQKFLQAQKTKSHTEIESFVQIFFPQEASIKALDDND